MIQTMLKKKNAGNMFDRIVKSDVSFLMCRSDAVKFLTTSVDANSRKSFILL